MAYIDKDKVKELITNYGKGAISDGLKTLDPVDDIVLLVKSVDLIPVADVVDSAWAKALEKDIEIIENKIIKVEAQRDALLEELQRLADCSSCKFNTPDAVDGCSAIMPCKDGHLWEWKGAKNEN